MRLFLLSLFIFLCSDLFAWTKIGEKPTLTDEMRCRVVEHTDIISGKEFEDNNVDRTFPMLQVIRKYDEKTDLLLLFGLNGPNGMFGIRGFGFISNADPQHVSNFPGQLWWSEMYESVGPWNIRAVNNEIERSAQKFTGGFHSYIDKENGRRYPSGENLGYSFTVDGKEIEKGKEVIGRKISCHSHERLGAYNTLDPRQRSGRMVLDCYNSFDLSKDKIFFKAYRSKRVLKPL